MEIKEFSAYEPFAQSWQRLGYTDSASEQYWILLGMLDPNELLVHLPDWLADEKVGYVDGGIPTAFIGHIDRETDKAILFDNSAAARPLSRLAHRIEDLQSSIERLESAPDTDPQRLQWLGNRLVDRQAAFETREDVTTLADEWLPKSELEFVGRRKV